MSSQSEQTKKYFDSLADKYAQRYTSRYPYHNYFFKERIRLATQKFDFEGKSILDIGAGTGSLYDCLKSSTQNFQYFASDISKKMLEQSQIPEHQRFVGKVEEIDFPVKKFDFIFMLGVTTYLSNKELIRTLQFIYTHSDLSTHVIITFTNKSSLDHFIRKLLKGLFGSFIQKKNLLSQNFSTKSFSFRGIKKLLHGKFKILDYQFFNFTLTPFNHLFPQASISFSRFFTSQIQSFFLKKKIGSDTILFLKKWGIGNDSN